MAKNLSFNNPDVIYENIRKMRSLNGLSQENMAMELGITQKHYSRIERGEVDISYRMLCKIADILKVKVQHLIGMEDMMIFNTWSESQKGNYYVYNATEIDKVQELYNLLLKEKDETIASLKNLISELKRKNK
jgi:transcriptional regulator with XRE-family HTH domain